MTTTAKTIPEPPGKPSGLIRLAIVNVKKVRRRKRYVVDMGIYHEPMGGKCHVCFAGAVMAGTLGASPTQYVTTYHWGLTWRYALQALNCFRLGRVYEGLNCLGLGIPDGLPMTMAVTHHDDDPEQFLADMEAMAATLEGAGL